MVDYKQPDQPQDETMGENNMRENMGEMGGDVGSGPVITNTCTAMKLKGLPFSVNKEDIVKFFEGFGLIEDSIKIGKMADGKLTGEAAVLFDDAKNCQMAHSAKNHQHIGSRWVKLIMVQPFEHEEFEQNQADKFDRRGDFGGYGGRENRRGGMHMDGGSSGFRGGRGRGGRGGGAASYPDTTVHLSDYVNSENRYKCLKMRGLPFSVTIKEIRDFFSDFRVADRDIIIDMNRGKPTGYSLVFLESESEAERAKGKLNKQYLGSRYVDLNYPELR